MANGEPPKKRRNMLAENRLVSEWVMQTYPGRAWTRHFRVGGYPPTADLERLDEADLAQIRNRNRWVDLVIHPPPDLIVVEAKMWDASNAVGKLMEYLAELPFTPEYQEWGSPPVTAIVLTAQHDPLAQVVIERVGFKYVFWEPPWIDEFYAAYPQRKRVPAPSSVAEYLQSRGVQAT